MKGKKIFAKLGLNVEAEGGEVLQTPNGEVTNLNGAQHEQGGIDLQVPEGSVIFSDTIGITGKDGIFRTLAERKKLRETTIKKINKSFSNGGNMFSRNGAKRIISTAVKEEESDIRFQNGINRELGTGEYSEGEDAKAEFGIGSAIGLVGQLGGGLLNSNNTEEYIKNRPQMPNFYRNYGLGALSKLNKMRDEIKSSKSSAVNLMKKNLQQQSQNQSSAIDSMGGTLNLKRALRAGSKLSSDSALATGIGQVEMDYAGKMASITGSEGDLLTQRDDKVAQGNKDIWTDAMGARDSYYSSKSKNIADMAAGVAGMGTQLNQTAYNNKFMGTLGKMKELTSGGTIPSINSSNGVTDLTETSGNWNSSLGVDIPGEYDYEEILNLAY